MYRTNVIAFSTLDGVTEDPDGSAGTPNGGWAVLPGPEVVGGASASAVRALARLSDSKTAPARLRLVSAGAVGPAVLIRHEREGL